MVLYRTVRLCYCMIVLKHELVAETQTSEDRRFLRYPQWTVQYCIYNSMTDPKKLF